MSTPSRTLSHITAVQPMHAGYDEARSAWNLSADLRPAGVVTARTVSQVQAAVALAADRGLRVAPMSTGHLATALPDLTRCLLLRVEIEGGVRVDPVTRRAHVPAGALWEDVVDAITPFGLAVAHGSSPDVGVVGYVLGGGMSFYGRRHGLTANHVTAFEVVTADGAVRRASAADHPELFWALRGGGANYGVVTAVELDLLPYAEIFAGSAFWPMADAEAIVSEWAAWTRTAPESVTTSLRLMRLPALPDVPEPLRDVPVVCVDGIALEEADGRELLRRLHAAAAPMLDMWETMPSAAALRIHGDPEQPMPGLSSHALLGELDEQALAALLGVAGDVPDCPLLFAELRQLGGALSRAPESGGARGRLDGRFALFGIGLPMVPGSEAAIEESLDALMTAMRPWDTGRVYLNFEERGGSAQRCFDPATYRRLSRLRAEWDPDRLFVGSHEVEPAGEPATAPLATAAR